MRDVRSDSTSTAPDSVVKPSSAGWLAWLTGGTAAAVVLGLFYLVMIASVRDKSATFDEPGHAFAGSAYWRTHDYRFDPENGNLPQRWFGLALLTIEQKFPSAESPGFRNADNWKLADTWLNRSGNDVGAILARGRAAAGLFAVALGAVVWLWSRRLFGPTAGTISLLIYVLNPTVLAHGALMTSDMAAALFFTVALGCFWAMLDRLTVLRVVLSGLAMGALFITKMSAVLIVPVALALAIVRVLQRRPIHGGMQRQVQGAVENALRGHRFRSDSILFLPRQIVGRGGKFLALLVAAIAHVALVALVIWAAFGFRFAAHPHAELRRLPFAVPWEAILDYPSPKVLLGKLGLSADQQARADAMLRTIGGEGTEWTLGELDTFEEIKRQVLVPAQAAALEAALRDPPLRPVARLAQFARQHHLLPEAYLYGMAHVWRVMGHRAAFLNGEISETGWRMFFPYSFAVKTPLAALGLLALAIATFLVGGRPWSRLAGTLPLWLMLVTYWAAAIASELNLGVRHLLPVHPAMFILAGVTARWCDPSAANPLGRRLRFAVAGLLVLLAADVLYRFPNFIAYFNGVVRPAESYRHLIDSSLDWGQELPALKRAMEQEHGEAPRFLAYFGTASPRTHGIAARQIFSFLEADRAEQPALKFVPGPEDDPSILAALQQMPDYDSSLVFPARSGDERATLLVKSAAALQLRAGTYYISASLLPPVHYPRAHGRWSERHEAVYQQLREVVQPLLSDQRATRIAAINRFPPITWNRIVRDFEEYRFARLAAWLRQRRPDDHVNFAILVFRLSNADLDLALNGRSPEGK